MFYGIKKKDRKTEGSKTSKNAKMSLQGSKKTSKTEPKVVSGHGFFDFGQSLFSCNPTRVLLDFHGFWVPRGGQKTIKKRFRKRNVEKDGPKPIFYEKMWKLKRKAPPGGGSTKSLFWWFLASGPQVVPKRPPGGAQGCPEPLQVPIFADFLSILGGCFCDLGYFWVFQGVPKP